MYSILVFLLLGLFLNTSDSAKILGVFTAPAKSHNIIHEALLLRLAELGHEVTIINSFKVSPPVPKTFRQIFIPFDQDENLKVLQNFMKVAEDGGRSDWSIMMNFFGKMATRHEDALSDPRVVDLMENETFDLLILGWFVNDFQIGLAAHFKCPAVIDLTARPSILTRRYVGNPSGPAFTTAAWLNYKGNMNFMQRVVNFLVHVLEYVVLEAFDYFFFEPRYTKLFPPAKYPSFEDSKKNISLVLVNHHFSQGQIEAYLPAMVEVGGMHIKEKPNPLPKDIQEWLDGATEGAIFFTLGSNAQSSHISAEKRDAMVRVFSKLKQRVIWKFESDLPNKPNNVMIGKWFPQPDILAHPNVKVFISHCGFGGVTEAKFHGVPILGLPVFADQSSNLQNLVAEGWGLPLSLSDVTEEKFSESLHELLNNRSYSNTVKKISSLYRDRPQSGMDRATFWIEYVIRHNGAKHMQSPAVHLNLLQYHSIDVIAFLIICIYISLKITKYVICLLFRKCRSKLKTKKD